MKGLKFISVLLLVNIMILIGHNLVPHQHHMVLATHPSSHECPKSNHEHHDEDSGSKHCHAFNDINFVKYKLAQVPMPEKLSSFMIIADPGTVCEENPGISAALRFIPKPIISSPQLTGSHSLRGPPVLS